MHASLVCLLLFIEPQLILMKFIFYDLEPHLKIPENCFESLVNLQ